MTAQGTPTPEATGLARYQYTLSVMECTRRGLTPRRVRQRKGGGQWEIVERIGSRQQRVGLWRDQATALATAAVHNEALVRMFSPEHD